jgi:hypothetical protein
LGAQIARALQNTLKPGSDITKQMFARRGQSDLPMLSVK